MPTPQPIVSERVKKHADGYIAAIFPDGCDPRQAIELKLAFYGGMAVMFPEMITILTNNNDDEENSAKELETLRQAISDRALRLNSERSR